MKKILLASGSGILILFLLLIAIYFGFLQETALVANEYTLETKDFNINFQTSKNYWEKSGCQPTGCDKISACSVRSQVVNYVMDCPIEQCYATSYNNCDSSGFQSNCAFGAQCGDTAYSQKYCDKHCSFSEEDVGVSGGVKYTELNNCAWQVQISDEQGNLIKKFDNTEKYGEEWDKTGYYRELIQYSNNQTTLKYMSDEFGSNWQGTKNQCLAVKFRVEDSKYRYDVCIGNDGTDKDKAVCEKAITKTCKLSCGSYTELDIDSCECKNVPPPNCVEGTSQDCMVQGQIGTQTCVNNQWSTCGLLPPTCDDGDKKECVINEKPGEKVCNNNKWSECKATEIMPYWIGIVIGLFVVFFFAMFGFILITKRKR